MKLKKAIYLLPLILLWPVKTFAFCPLCAVATGAGVGLFRWLGVDDLIAGLWLGAFGFSSAVIFADFLAGKGMSKILSAAASAVVIAAPLIISLYPLGFFSVENKILGVEKVIFGMAGGAILLFAAPFLNGILKKFNGGSVFFPHQKVAFAIVSLLAASLIFNSIL